MAQQQVPYGSKFPSPPFNDWPIEQVNTTNDAINANAIDAQSRISASEIAKDASNTRTTVLEENGFGDIETFTTSTLPVTATEGKIIYLSDVEYNAYYRGGTWYKMSNNAAVVDPNDLDVYLVLGQSNAEGYCFWANLDPADQANDRTDNLQYTASLTGGTTWQAGNWAQIDPPNNNSWEIAGCFGSEVGFGDTVKSIVEAGSSSTFTKRVAVAKFAKGGTSLSHDWSPTQGGGGYMYNGWQSTLTDFQTKLTNAGYTFTIRGVIWFQGEQDSFTQAQADAYEANLTAFIADVRSDIGDPNLPFVISKIKWEAGNDPGFEATVRTAQQNVADALTHVAILDAANYTRRDTVHLDADSMYQYGIDAVTAMEQAILGNE